MSDLKSIKATKDILYASNAIDTLEGIFPEIYLVGGAVRDALLGNKTTDLDFAVPNSPEEIIHSLEKISLPVYKVGLPYNTVGTTIGNFAIQITTFRAEHYEEGSRNPHVEEITDIYSDLDRRDFTINAMALSKADFIDTHNGTNDLKNKQIKSVLSAEQKFSEDPVRILRAYRLVATYGFNIEEQTLHSIERARGKLKNVAAERIGDELRKLLKGSYWSDAIFELIENHIFNVCLEVFGITARVIIDNAFSVLDNYSARSLESMSEAERWVRLVEIIHDSEKNSGASTLDVESTADHICIKASLPRTLRLSIKGILRGASNDKSTAARYIATLGPRSTNTNSDVAEKYERINSLKSEGKIAYYENRQFNVARNIFREAIGILDGLYDSAIYNIRDQELKRDMLRKLSRRYVDYLSFEVAAYIMDSKLYMQYSRTADLERRINRDIPTGRLNKKDYKQSVQEGIARIYKEHLFDSRLESFDNFLGSTNNIIAEEKKEYFMRSYIAHQLKIVKSPKEKRNLNKKMATIVKRATKDGSYGLDYYDPYIDYLYYSVLSSENIETFRNNYDVLMEALPDYIAIANSEGKSSYAKKRAYLNSASCNVYALKLPISLDEKLYYASCAVDDYTDAGFAYQRNANRYRVLQDWFTFVQWLKNEDRAGLTYEKVAQEIVRLKGYGYIDPDEEYFKEKLHEISMIRDLQVEIYKFTQFKGKRVPTLDDPALTAILTLRDERVISETDSLSALRNYVSLKANASIDIDEIQVPDNMVIKKEEDEIQRLIEGLEGKSTEFKASWKYDIDKSSSQHQPCTNPELSMAICRTITAFMNTEGGTILIGVTDNRVACGIEETDVKLFKKTNDIGYVVDKIKLEIDNIFGQKVGQDFQDYKEASMKKYRGKTLIMIKVRKVNSEEPVTFGEEICIRGEAGTRALTPKEVAGYIRKRASEQMKFAQVVNTTQG